MFLLKDIHDLARPRGGHVPKDRDLFETDALRHHHPRMDYKLTLLTHRSLASVYKGGGLISLKKDWDSVAILVD